MIIGFQITFRLLVLSYVTCVAPSLSFHKNAASDPRVVCAYHVVSRWRDCLLNLSFCNDPNHIVCELQLSHRNMMVVRKTMAGHEDYVTYRSAIELREARKSTTPTPSTDESRGSSGGLGSIPSASLKKQGKQLQQAKPSELRAAAPPNPLLLN